MKKSAKNNNHRFRRCGNSY